MELDIQVIQTQHPKQKPEDESSLGFGRLFTDHMFLVEYTEDGAGTTPEFSPTGLCPSIRPPCAPLQPGRSFED